MGTVLEHVHDTNSAGYGLLQADKYKPLVQLFGALNYNEQTVQLGDHFTEAMTKKLFGLGVGINDGFALPVANALRADPGLQNRIVTLAQGNNNTPDAQGIALIDSALTDIQNGADVENTINAAYAKRFGQQQLAQTKPRATDPQKRPAPPPNANSGGGSGGEDPGSSGGGDFMSVLGNMGQSLFAAVMPILNIILSVFTNNKFSSWGDLLGGMFGGAAAASNGASGGGRPDATAGAHPTVEAANNANRTVALGHAINGEDRKIDGIMGKDGKRAMEETAGPVRSDGSHAPIITVTMADGTKERWEQNYQAIDKNTGTTLMGYVRLNLDNDNAYSPDGKLHTFLDKTGNLGSKQDAALLSSIVKGTEPPVVNGKTVFDASRDQVDAWKQSTQEWVNKNHLSGISVDGVGAHSIGTYSIGAVTDQLARDGLDLSKTQVSLMTPVGLGEGITYLKAHGVDTAILENNGASFRTNHDPFAKPGGGYQNANLLVNAYQMPDSSDKSDPYANHRLAHFSEVYYQNGVSAFTRRPDWDVTPQKNPALAAGTQNKANLALGAYMATAGNMPDAPNVHASAAPAPDSRAASSPTGPGIAPEKQLGRIYGGPLRTFQIPDAAGSADPVPATQQVAANTTPPVARFAFQYSGSDGQQASPTTSTTTLTFHYPSLGDSTQGAGVGDKKPAAASRAPALQN